MICNLKVKSTGIKVGSTDVQNKQGKGWETASGCLKPMLALSCSTMHFTLTKAVYQYILENVEKPFCYLTVYSCRCKYYENILSWDRG